MDLRTAVDRITAAGQVFRMAMYHPNHPDKDYEIANLVEVEFADGRHSIPACYYEFARRYSGPDGVTSR